MEPLTCGNYIVNLGKTKCQKIWLQKEFSQGLSAAHGFLSTCSLCSELLFSGLVAFQEAFFSGDPKASPEALAMSCIFKGVVRMTPCLLTQLHMFSRGPDVRPIGEGVMWQSSLAPSTVESAQLSGEIARTSPCKAMDSGCGLLDIISHQTPLRFLDPRPLVQKPWMPRLLEPKPVQLQFSAKPSPSGPQTLSEP